MKTRNVLRAYGLVIGLGVAFGAFATCELRASADAVWDIVHKHAESLVIVGRLKDATDRACKFVRMFLLTGNARYLEQAQDSAEKAQASAAALSGRLEDPESRQLLAQARAVATGHLSIRRELTAAARAGEPLPSIVARIEPRTEEPQAESERLLDALDHHESRAFEEAQQAAVVTTNRRQHGIELVAILALAAAVALGALLRRNMTLLQQSRESLEETNRALESTNNDLDAFGGRVAHDLRNLLAPLGLAAASLKRRAANPETVLEIASRLERLSRRADGLIESMLAFARAGQSPDEAASASVRDVVCEVREDLEPSARNVAADVEVEAEELSVACGPHLLHTVLMNLVSNALKFLDGCARREVRVSARRLGARCEIAVTDTGPGIPADALGKVFTQFYRVPGTRAPGTGIGLATVRRILEAHGGSIHVQSVVGRGSVFTVTLPCVESVPVSEPVGSCELSAPVAA